MPERVLALSQQVSAIATSRVDEIRRITQMSKILGLNAAVEAARSHNAGFAVVANEVGSVAANIETLANQLHDELGSKTQELRELGEKLIANIRGSRLADLALNMIDIVDRNLYERSCDVRWWATDSAVVDCATGKDANACALASQRLGVILDSYTVYLDLWIADPDGKVLANGRPERYAVQGKNIAGEEWFQRGLETRSGADFIACDVRRCGFLEDAGVATYATAIRKGGANTGRVVGVLGIFFDWEKQSQAVVNSVRLTADERPRTRCMIIDARHRILASTQRDEVFNTYRIETGGEKIGSYVDGGGNLVGFALTPGYETYKGLGWYGVIGQRTR